MIKTRRFVDGLMMCLAGTAGLLGLVAAPASAQIINDMPDAIVCSVADPTGVLPWQRLIFYVSATMEDGKTLYKTLTSDPVVLLAGADGRIAAGNLADCNQRTVDELLRDGQAFYLSAPAPSATPN